LFLWSLGHPLLDNLVNNTITFPPPILMYKSLSGPARRYWALHL
jgi:hypothetical protein